MDSASVRLPGLSEKEAICDIEAKFLRKYFEGDAAVRFGCRQLPPVWGVGGPAGQGRQAQRGARQAHTGPQKHPPGAGVVAGAA